MTEEGIASLTEREREVLQLLLAGHTGKSAAAELDLSVHTINDYLREARKKLGVSSSKQAARLLGASQVSAPQNDAANTIGMGTATGPDHIEAPTQRSDAKRSRTVWIIGAIIMLATIVAIALAASSNGTSESKPDTAVTSPTGEDQAAAQAAQAWVKLIDQNAWEDSWDSSSSVFQSSVTPELWATQGSAVREPLGAVVMRKVDTIDRRGELPGAPAGDYQIVHFGTDFAETSARVETVVMVREDGQWKVVGYFIR